MLKKSVFIVFGIFLLIFIIYTAFELEKIDRYEIKKQYWTDIYFKNKKSLNNFVILAEEDEYSCFQHIVFSENNIIDIIQRKDVQTNRLNIFREEPMRSILTDIGGVGIERIINYSSVGYYRYYIICFNKEKPGNCIGLRYQCDDLNDEIMINDNSRIEDNWYFIDETYAVPVEERYFFRKIYDFLKGFKLDKKA